jgi:peptide/nickel transport system permease protein
MGAYIFRRGIYMIVTLFVVSFVSFFIIQIPPGDYVTSYAQNLATSGTVLDSAELESLRQQFGLDRSIPVRYWMWMTNMFHGDLGYSFEWQRPVNDLLGQRLLLTVLISIVTLLLTYAIAIPIGIYSATHQYSPGDHIVTAVGLVGLAAPGFMLALVLLVVWSKVFGYAPTGLFSGEYTSAPWSWAKVWDLLMHLPIPALVISTAGTAALTRVMRATLLDELKKPYVVAARARGMSGRKLLFRYPVRIAINPIASTIGWVLPGIISGSTIVEIVLALPTIGPLLLRSLLSQDTYLAASLLMILSFLTVIGTFVSDIILLWLDPRIRFERSA